MTYPPPQGPVYVEPVYRQAVSNQVVISKIDIPFWNLVGFMIKLAVAAIPAGLVIMIVMAIFTGCMWATLAMFGLGVGSLLSGLSY